ncbi:MAG TPA: hypothetical protein ENN17_08480 [bacterium]|nr:hypothetical protein [bacterium]
MFDLFIKGGPFMWPLLILTVTIITLSVKKTLDLFVREHLDLRQKEMGLNAILFWGVIAGSLGVTAQLLGIYLALGEIRKAADISMALVVDGYRVSFITTLFGLYLFIGAAILWFLLRWKYKVMTRER